MTASTTATAAEQPLMAVTSPRRLIDRVLRMRELAILVVLAVMLVATQIDNTSFLSEQGIKDLLLNATILVLVAVGEAVVVITGNVDLSVGSVLGVTAFAAGDLLRHGGNPVLAISLAVLLGAGFGAFNGLLVGLGQVPSLVVTLGTLYAFRGVAFLWTNGRQVNAETLPDAFLNLGTGSILGIPTLALIALVVVVVVGQALRDFRSGRELYAIGSNPEGARLAGVRSERRVFAAFLLSGALAGLAGVLFTARFGTVDATAGASYELTVISATVVGGVAIFGGTGSVYGAALGALLLQTITSSLIVLKVDAFWQQAAIGALLLVAIAFDRLVGLRLDARLRRRSVRRAG